MEVDALRARVAQLEDQLGSARAEAQAAAINHEQAAQAIEARYVALVADNEALGARLKEEQARAAAVAKVRRRGGWQWRGCCAVVSLASVSICRVRSPPCQSAFPFPQTPTTGAAA